MSSLDSLAASPRTTLRRLPQRGSHARADIHRILDDGLVCHVGFVVDGQPYVIPTIYARVDERLYIHGSAASRMLRTLADGVEVCVTVTLLDGVVLARSAFHHSVNYRSVVVLGRATPVGDPEEKLMALRAVTEHVVPGRWDNVRSPNPQELKATLVLTLSITEASAKTRSGPPLDDEHDYGLPVWAGELPLQTTVLTPVADPRLPSGTALPGHVLGYAKRFARDEVAADAGEQRVRTG
jgi:hypothetical protein